MSVSITFNIITDLSMKEINEVLQGTVIEGIRHPEYYLDEDDHECYHVLSNESDSSCWRTYVVKSQWTGSLKMIEVREVEIDYMLFDFSDDVEPFYTQGTTGGMLLEIRWKEDNDV